MLWYIYRPLGELNLDSQFWCHIWPYVSATECVTLTCRFAHSSVQLENGQIVVVGGFGPSGGAGPHTRLDDVLILESAGIGEGQWKCTILHSSGGGPGKHNIVVSQELMWHPKKHLGLARSPHVHIRKALQH